MRSVFSPRDAIDAFERNHPDLSSEDVQFFDRLRSERFVREVATIWRYIGTADVRVIECAVKALRVAKALPKLPPAANKSERDLKAVNDAVRIVRNYFAEYQGADADELRRGLAWAERFFKPIDESGLRFAGWLTEAEAAVVLNSTSKKVPRINRKYRTSAAQRSTFMVQMRHAMQVIFRRPCDAAVAALTTVAFEVDVSIDNVRNANRSIRRKI
jgi:uncharacterized protein (DUF1501 family)